LPLPVRPVGFFYLAIFARFFSISTRCCRHSLAEDEVDGKKRKLNIFRHIMFMSNGDFFVLLNEKDFSQHKINLKGEKEEKKYQV
jgi:hypothetical protein